MDIAVPKNRKYTVDTAAISQRPRFTRGNLITLSPKMSKPTTTLPCFKQKAYDTVEIALLSGANCKWVTKARGDKLEIYISAGKNELIRPKETFMLISDPIMVPITLHRCQSDFGRYNIYVFKRTFRKKHNGINIQKFSWILQFIRDRQIYWCCVSNKQYNNQFMIATQKRMKHYDKLLGEKWHNKK